MSVGSPLYAKTYDATLDPQGERAACHCDLSRIAREIVALAHHRVEELTVAARIPTPRRPAGGDYAKFLGRVEDALDDVYAFGACDECAQMMPQDEERL